MILCCRLLHTYTRRAELRLYALRNTFIIQEGEATLVRITHIKN